MTFKFFFMKKVLRGILFYLTTLTPLKSMHTQVTQRRRIRTSPKPWIRKTFISHILYFSFVRFSFKYYSLKS